MVLGSVLAALSVFMLVPTLLAVIDQSGHQRAFLWSAAISLIAALLLVGASYRTSRRSNGLLPRQLFLITASVWFALPVFAGLPLYFGVDGMSWTDAVFEAVSGMTTTGSTVLTGLDDMSRDLLLWRSLLQWMGASVSSAWLPLCFLSCVSVA